MENSLKTVQVFAKVGKILSKVIWICCIVGTVGCLIGFFSLFAGVGEIAKINGITIYGLIEKEAEMSVNSMYAATIIGAVMCTAQLIIAKASERYFSNELIAGTPFTFEGAEEMKRLGILTISVSLGSVAVVGIIYGIMSVFMKDLEDLDLGNYVSVGMGITFLVVSFVLRYGAELESRKEAKEIACEELSEEK